MTGLFVVGGFIFFMIAVGLIAALRIRHLRRAIAEEVAAAMKKKRVEYAAGDTIQISGEQIMAMQSKPCSKCPSQTSEYLVVNRYGKMRTLCGNCVRG